MRRVLTAFLVVVAFLILVLAGQYADLSLRVARLERADASRDAEKALASGDRRLLGTDGAAGLDVPGADSATYVAAAAGHCGIRMVRVSHRFVLRLQEREAQAWFSYARRYNSYVVSTVGKKSLCASAA